MSLPDKQGGMSRPNPAKEQTDMRDFGNALHEIHCGVTFGFYARYGYYESAAAFEQVDEMAKTGVKWVALIVTIMQEGFAASRQFHDFEHTPGDLELVGIIDYIHKKGMKVELRPMLECFDGKGRLGVMFPADCERMPGLVCDYASRWFDSMKRRSAYYAKIAEKTGCEMFSLDSELDHIISFNREWKEVLAAVREVYSGPVTSCHTMHTGVIDFEKVLMDKEHWFYDLDALSVSNYIKAADRPGTTVEEMMAYMIPERDKLRRVAALYGKPVLLGENGCCSCTGAAMDPSGWAADGRYDGLEQANYLEAVLRTFWSEPWWYGLDWWKWDDQNYRPTMKNDPAGDKGFTVLGKPAQEVMRSWFGREDIRR